MSLTSSYGVKIPIYMFKLNLKLKRGHPTNNGGGREWCRREQRPRDGGTDIGGAMTEETSSPGSTSTVEDSASVADGSGLNTPLRAGISSAKMDGLGGSDRADGSGDDGDESSSDVVSWAISTSSEGNKSEGGRSGTTSPDAYADPEVYVVPRSEDATLSRDETPSPGAVTPGRSTSASFASPQDSRPLSDSGSSTVRRSETPPRLRDFSANLRIAPRESRNRRKR
jgi:hypothetical protein